MSCRVQAGQSTGTNCAGLPEVKLSDVSVRAGYSSLSVATVLQFAYSADTSNLSEVGPCPTR